MIGSYLDKQVTNIKNGVLAAGSLIGIGMIIYFVVKKRAAIASGLGLGKKSTPEEVTVEKPKLLAHKADTIVEEQEETVEITTDDDFEEETDEDDSENTEES